MTKASQKLKILSSLRIFFQPCYRLIFLDILLCLIYFFLTSFKTKYEGGLVETVSKNKEVEKLKFAVVRVIVFYLVYHILDKIREKINLKLAHSAATQLKTLVFGNIIKPKDHNQAKSSPGAISALINTMSKDLREWSPDLFIEPFYCVIRGIVLIYFMNGISPTLTKVALCITPFKVLLAFWKRKENTGLAKKYNEMTSSLATKIEQILQIFYQSALSNVKIDTNDILKQERKLNSVHKQHIEDPWAFGFRKGLLEKIVQVILVWHGGMLVIEGKLTVGQLTAFNVQFRVFIGLFTTFKNSSKALSSALIRYEKFFELMTIDQKYQDKCDKEFYAKVHKCSRSLKQLCYRLSQIIDYLTEDIVVSVVFWIRFVKNIILHVLTLHSAQNKQNNFDNEKTHVENKHNNFGKVHINTELSLKKIPIIKSKKNKPHQIDDYCTQKILEQQILSEGVEQYWKMDLDSLDSIFSEVATSVSDTPGISADNILKELDQDNEKHSPRGPGNFLENSDFETKNTGEIIEQ